MMVWGKTRRRPGRPRRLRMASGAPRLAAATEHPWARLLSKWKDEAAVASKAVLEGGTPMSGAAVVLIKGYLYFHLRAHFGFRQPAEIHDFSHGRCELRALSDAGANFCPVLRGHLNSHPTIDALA